MYYKHAENCVAQDIPCRDVNAGFGDIPDLSDPTATGMGSKENGRKIMNNRVIRSWTGDVSRRGVLTGAAAVGAAGLILPGMSGAARAQSRGGTFRAGIGHGSTTDGYDPGLWDNLYAQVFAAARHTQLIEVG